MLPQLICVDTRRMWSWYWIDSQCSGDSNKTGKYHNRDDCFNGLYSWRRSHHRHAIPPSYESHDDVIKWKHFPRHWPFVSGIHWSPVDSPSQRPVTPSFGVYFDLRLNKQLGKQSGDLRRHRAHYDATVMVLGVCIIYLGNKITMLQRWGDSVLISLPASRPHFYQIGSA